MTGKHKIAFIVFLALVIEARPVDAIVVRHDRDEQAFIDLAQKFPATVTFYLSARRGSFAGMCTLVEPLEGKVLRISGETAESADPQTRKDAMAVERESGQSPYKAIVELKEQVLSRGDFSRPLTPGMQVAAEIRQVERTVIEYLLSPVQKTLYEAARER